MSGVVIRCPNCGTVQSELGECEACHEATTRWFCPNHEPGRWLDGPSCPVCGARVGVPGASRPSPPRPRPAPSSPPSRHPPPPRRPPAREREEIFTSDVPVEAEAEPWRGPVFTPRDPRSIGREDAREAWPIDPTVILPTAVRVVSLFGCLRRLVMLVILLIVLAVVAFYALFGVGGVFGSAGDASAPAYAVAAAGDAATFPDRTGSKSGDLIASARTPISVVPVGRVARTPRGDFGDVWLVRRRASLAASRSV